MMMMMMMMMMLMKWRGTGSSEATWVVLYDEDAMTNGRRKG